jgi:hypothetical protein
MTAAPLGPLKVYRRHNCDAQHRNTRTFMRCAIPRAAWVVGDGPYALIAWCRVPTVSLWHDKVDALEHLHHMSQPGGACGGRCNRRHEVVYVNHGLPLARPTPAPPPEPRAAARPTEPVLF